MFKETVLTVALFAGTVMGGAAVTGQYSDFRPLEPVAIDCVARQDRGALCRGAIKMLAWQVGKPEAARIILCGAFKAHARSHDTPDGEKLLFGAVMGVAQCR